MGLLDMFRRPKGTESEKSTPLGIGGEVDPDEAGDPMEGGPHVYGPELSQHRWAAINEAIATGRSNPDPLMWQGGELAFDFERAQMHDHEALRRRLAARALADMREDVRGLYDRAREVGRSRDRLRQVDNDLLEITRDYRRLRQEVENDPVELGRFGRMSSKSTQQAKIAIAVLFVVAELVITGQIFDQAIDLDIPLLGFVLAGGVMGLLILIPHYLALGIKEGITRYYHYEHEGYVASGEDEPVETKRKVHYEDRDDLGFRITSLVVGLILAVLMLPLASLRAEDIEIGDAPWWVLFVLFLFLQLGISGYFFLREWLDHGSASHNLWKYGELKASAEETREYALDDHGAALAEFHDEAEDLIFTLRAIPHWDHYISQTYYATSRYYRHGIGLEKPELQPFVFWARRPHLGHRDEAGKSEHALDPVAEEHFSLDENGPMGRDWWIREVNSTLAELADDNDWDLPEESEPADGDVDWLFTKSPSAILRMMLRQMGIDGPYRTPPELTVEDRPLDVEETEADDGVENMDERSDDGDDGGADSRDPGPTSPPGPSDGSNDGSNDDEGEDDEPLADVLSVEGRRESTEEDPDKGSEDDGGPAQAADDSA